MKSGLGSGLAGFAIGLTVAVAAAPAAVEAMQHQHPATPAQKPTTGAMKGMESMKDMHAMMADPAMRQKMIANMAQCRDMMSMMIEHMQHEGMKKDTAPPQQ
jgi:hypothetical protein